MCYPDEAFFFFFNNLHNGFCRFHYDPSWQRLKIAQQATWTRCPQIAVISMNKFCEAANETGREKNMPSQALHTVFIALFTYPALDNKRNEVPVGKRRCLRPLLANSWRQLIPTSQLLQKKSFFMWKINFCDGFSISLSSDIKLLSPGTLPPAARRAVSPFNDSSSYAASVGAEESFFHPRNGDERWKVSGFMF